MNPYVPTAELQQLSIRDQFCSNYIHTHFLSSILFWSKSQIYYFICKYFSTSC